MNAPHVCHRVASIEAERILAQQLEVDACSANVRMLNGQTIRRFLADLSEPDERGDSHLLLDEDRLCRWMIRDVAGRDPMTARKRLGIVGRYLRALATRGLLSIDLMSVFRGRHDNRAWHEIVKALQSPDPESALATLHPDLQAAGPLVAHVRPYLELHRSLGKKYRTHRLVLNRFSRFLQTQNVHSPQVVTPTHVEGWLAALTCSPAVQTEYARIMGRFFEHIRQLEVVAQNPVVPALLGRGRSPRRQFRPFIFTRDQIAAVLARARQVPSSSRFPLRGATCHTMLALLYTLGLRHGEARRLRVCDVDWTLQALFISETKFHKSRYVPFGPKVSDCLRQFLELRGSVPPPLREDDSLFVTQWGRPLGCAALLNVFHDILRELKVLRVEGQRRPRLHDLRHTFAVHRLLRWYREGGDVQARLPALSTFMGHLEPLSTQVYLTITSELLQEANARFHRHFGRLFDEESHP